MKNLFLLLLLLASVVCVSSCSFCSNSEVKRGPDAEDYERDSLRYLDILNAKDLAEKVEMERRYINTPLKSDIRGTYRAVHYEEVEDMLSKDEILLSKQQAEKNNQQIIEQGKRQQQQNQTKRTYYDLKNYLLNNTFKTEMDAYRFTSINLDSKGIYGEGEYDYGADYYPSFTYYYDFSTGLIVVNLPRFDEIIRFKIYSNGIEDTKSKDFYEIFKDE